jgi:hypothetical protein
MCLAVVTLNINLAAATTTHNNDKKRRPRIKGAMGGKEVEFLIDSGASCTVMSDTLFTSQWKHWQVTRLPLPQHVRITGVTGNTIKVVDYVEMEVSLLGRTFTRPVLVIAGLEALHAIIGWDTIKEEGIVIDGAKNQVYFSEKKTTTEQWEMASLRAARRSVLQPRTVTYLEVAAMVDQRVVPAGEEGICSAIPGSTIGIWEAAVTMGEHGKVRIPIVNISHETISLKAGDVLGYMSNPRSDGETLEPLTDEVLAGIFGNFGKDPPEPGRGQTIPLSDDERKTLADKAQIKAEEPWKQRYLDLILRYHDVCSKNKYDLGFADVIQHSIRMQDEIPVHNRQFRVPFEHESVLHDYVDELLKQGAIEVSRSPYNSAVFCVAKKLPPNHPEGDPVPLRCVLDYRGVNAKSLPDRYSIREVRECIDEVGRLGSKVFTTVDLTAGFWQLALEEQSRQFTAFTVPGRGTRYQWRVTPMGLQGSPASFSRLMDYVMRAVEGVLTYIDDVLVHTPTHEMHIQRLEEVLLRLRKYGLKLNMDKTIFGASSVQYLGYTLDQEGISPSVDKMEAVRESSPPRTPKQVREFIGLCNYFRFLIPNFSRLSSPITALTKKDCGWDNAEMPKTARECYEKLKQMLCDKPVVAYPNRTGTFIVYTDGSLGDNEYPGGLGAVLLQRQEDESERVIAYASRGLKDHEKNYSAFLLEMGAAVYGIDHFDVYLKGRPFILCTDHKPLEKLSAVHTKTLNRLQQAMLQYDFTVEYRRGETNTVADFLSRNASIAAISDHEESLIDEQKGDPDINQIRSYLETGVLPKARADRIQWIRRMADACFLERDCVWYKIEGKHRDKVALYAPKKLRSAIVEAAHNRREAGHGGNDRTISRIRLSYYWPGMTNDVDKYIKACTTCQRSKATMPKSAPLQPMPTCDEPNMRVHVDLFGPLKTSEAGNKYIMVMTDAFTKYVELAAIETKEAHVVARAFFERWICRFSAPEMLITDQGKEFCNHLMEELCNLWNIDKKRTSGYHPQTNSSAESYNRTLIKYMRSVLDNASTLEWEDILPCLMLSYNCHVHRSTQESPFFLTYLHDPRLPYFDVEKPRKFYDADNYVHDTYKLMQIAHGGAVKSMEEAKSAMMAYHGKKAKERNFEVGDRVLVHFPNTPRNVNQKFFKKWREFTVIAKMGQVNLQVRASPRSKPVIVHVNRVVPFSEEHEPEAEEQVQEEEVQGQSKTEKPQKKKEEDEPGLTESEDSEDEETEDGPISSRIPTETTGRPSTAETDARATTPVPEEELNRPTREESRETIPTAMEETTRRQTRSRGPVIDIPLPIRPREYKTTKKRKKKMSKVVCQQAYLGKHFDPDYIEELRREELLQQGRDEEEERFERDRLAWEPPARQTRRGHVREGEAQDNVFEEEKDDDDDVPVPVFWYDPWLTMANLIFDSNAVADLRRDAMWRRQSQGEEDDDTDADGRASTERRLRSQGPVPDEPLPKVCPAKRRPKKKE